jgi:hypothetical protein
MRYGVSGVAAGKSGITRMIRRGLVHSKVYRWAVAPRPYRLVHGPSHGTTGSVTDGSAHDDSDPTVAVQCTISLAITV